MSAGESIESEPVFKPKIAAGLAFNNSKPCAKSITFSETNFNNNGKSVSKVEIPALVSGNAASF